MECFFFRKKKTYVVWSQQSQLESICFQYTITQTLNIYWLSEKKLNVERKGFKISAFK